MASIVDTTTWYTKLMAQINALVAASINLDANKRQKLIFIKRRIQLQNDTIRVRLAKSYTNVIHYLPR